MSPYDFVSILLVIGIAVVLIRRQRADRRPGQRSDRWENQGDDGSVTPMTSGALEPRVGRGARRSDNDGGDGGYPTGGGPGPSHSHGHTHGHTGSWGDGHGGHGGGDGGGGDGGGGDGGGGGGGD